MLQIQLIFTMLPFSYAKNRLLVKILALVRIVIAIFQFFWGGRYGKFWDMVQILDIPPDPGKFTRVLQISSNSGENRELTLDLGDNSKSGKLRYLIHEIIKPTKL